jgi:hypothetical protein
LRTDALDCLLQCPISTVARSNCRGSVTCRVWPPGLLLSIPFSFVVILFCRRFSSVVGAEAIRFPALLARFLLAAECPPDLDLRARTVSCARSLRPRILFPASVFKFFIAAELLVVSTTGEKENPARVGTLAFNFSARVSDRFSRIRVSCCLAAPVCGSCARFRFLSWSSALLVQFLVFLILRRLSSNW